MINDAPLLTAYPFFYPSLFITSSQLEVSHIRNRLYPVTGCKEDRASERATNRNHMMASVLIIRPSRVYWYVLFPWFFRVLLWQLFPSLNGAPTKLNAFAFLIREQISEWLLMFGIFCEHLSIWRSPDGNGTMAGLTAIYRCNHHTPQTLIKDTVHLLWDRVKSSAFEGGNARTRKPGEITLKRMGSQLLLCRFIAFWERYSHERQRWAHRVPGFEPRVSRKKVI